MPRGGAISLAAATHLVATRSESLRIFFRARCCARACFTRRSRFPTLPANLEEHTCCLYAFVPIPSEESNSDIAFPINSIAAPSAQTNSVYWECLQKVCPNFDYPCFAT